MSTQLESEPITVLVDFPPRPGVRKGLLSTPDLAQQSAQALDRAMDSIQGMAQRVSDMRTKLPPQLAAVEIEFGLKLDAEAGALVSRVGGEASIQVRLKWEKGKKWATATWRRSVRRRSSQSGVHSTGGYGPYCQDNSSITRACTPATARSLESLVRKYEAPACTAVATCMASGVRRP